jgi:cytosine/adenosine deaminase-related metal-dependent hydrolase
MEVWPSDVGLRGQASNHPVLRWLKTVVVSDREKAHEMCQVGTRKTYQKMLGGVDIPRRESLLKRR